MTTYTFDNVEYTTESEDIDVTFIECEQLMNLKNNTYDFN